MASNDLKIPTIDMCTEEWESTKNEVFQALQEYGCFEAKYDKVPNEIREAMFGASKEIFECPLETKMKNGSDKPFHGYIGQIPQLPLYESMSIPDLFQHQSVENFANIFWPDGNPNFCNVCKSYSKTIVELEEIVKKMILESLGLKNYIDEILDISFFYLRFIHYKAADQSENGNKHGLTDHTDNGFLTIISQNQVNGLQVLKKTGEWIDVNIAPNSYLVIAGDSFMAWTNGRLHSPVHRVMMAGDSDRFSFLLQSSPKSGYIIEAPKELVDEEHPVLFKPYEILGLFKYVVSPAGAKVGSDRAFKAYCGV